LPLLHTNDDLDRLAATFNDMLDRLQKAVGEMKQFTASIAHELRTPLTALRGEAEMALMRGRTLEDFRGVIGSQLEEFDKLTRLINQLLTLARAEAGDLQLARESFDAVPILKDIVESFQPIADEKDIALQFEPPEVMEIHGDAQWIERAVVNLLDNAVKYTGHGGRVMLKISQDRSESRIEVRDTGCGIPDAALPHIYERFYRADPSRGKDIEGVGLGLSLVQWIVNQHGGAIDVTTRLGDGTAFVIHLPGRDAPDIKQV
jgi:heavy metal sensor kinase